MSTNSTEQYTPAVGDIIESHAQISHLPIGTTITWEGSLYADRTLTDEGWRVQGDSRPLAPPVITGQWTIKSLPFYVGQILTEPSEFAAVPIGTKLEGSLGLRTRTGEDEWLYGDTSVHRGPTGGLLGRYTIVELPGQPAAETEEPRKFEIGDRVRISDDPHTHEDAGWVAEDFAGQVGEIVGGAVATSHGCGYDVKLARSHRTQFIGGAYLTLEHSPEQGDLITDDSVLDALPVGAKIRYVGHNAAPTAVRTKTEDGWKFDFSNVGDSTCVAGEVSENFRPITNDWRVEWLPGDPIREGLVLTSEQMFLDVPVGWQIRYNGAPTGTLGTYTKASSTDFTRDSDGHPGMSAAQFRPFLFEVVGPVSQFHVGQHVNTREEYDALPVGTVMHLSTNAGRTRTKEADNQWRGNGIGSTTSEHLSSTGYTIVSLPVGPPASNHFNVPNTEPDPELVVHADDTASQDPVSEVTVRQWLAKTRTVAISACTSTDKDEQVVIDLFDEQGIEQEEPTVGMPVCSRDEYLLDSLPNGTLLLAGDMTDSYQIARVVGDCIEHMAGYLSVTPRTVFKVTHIPGGSLTPADWVTETMTSEEGQAAYRQIEEFKATLVRLGDEAKRQYNWCGDYESTLDELGIEHEPDTETITVRIEVSGTTELYDELGSYLTNVDSVSSVTVRWSHEFSFDTEVDEGDCACNNYSRSDVRTMMENAEITGDIEEWTAYCSND